MEAEEERESREGLGLALLVVNDRRPGNLVIPGLALVVLVVRVRLARAVAGFSPPPANLGGSRPVPSTAANLAQKRERRAVFAAKITGQLGRGLLGPGEWHDDDDDDGEDDEDEWPAVTNGTGEKIRTSSIEIGTFASGKKG